MNKNVGYADSYIRFLVGVAFLLQLFIFKMGFIGVLFNLIIGIYMLKSAFSRYCSLYTLLKFDTTGNECTCNDASEAKAE